MVKMADNAVSVLDLSKLKVPDLKRELKSRGLNTSGNKNDLLERLQGALKNSDAVGHESVDDLDEDLLNDDYDETLEASESVISDIDTALNESITQKGEKRKSDGENADNDSKKSDPPPKKVVLNRNTPIIADKRVSTESKEGSDKTSNSAEEKKVIKLSEISVKERLEMRAKKFDVAITQDAKKVARAERFGVQANSADSPSKPVNASLDVLKQRAERFGGSVSPALSKLEVQEKLERRKARFGGSTNTSNTTKSSLDNEKAKQQRLDRFKLPVK